MTRPKRPRKELAEKKQAAADALREAFPRLAFTVERLDLLDDALRHLDDQSAQAADLYGTDPQQAALILIRALASLHYSARPQQPPIADLMVPARGTEIIDGLLEAFAELKRGGTHPLVAVKRRAGAPRMGREKEALQFLAAAAAEYRIARTGKSVDDVCREIAKELGLSRADAARVKEWRRIIKQGRRGEWLKREFARLKPRHDYWKERLAQSRYELPPGVKKKGVVLLTTKEEEKKLEECLLKETEDSFLSLARDRLGKKPPRG